MRQVKTTTCIGLSELLATFPRQTHNGHHVACDRSAGWRTDRVFSPASNGVHFDDDAWSEDKCRNVVVPTLTTRDLLRSRRLFQTSCWQPRATSGQSYLCQLPCGWPPRVRRLAAKQSISFARIRVIRDGKHHNLPRLRLDLDLESLKPLWRPSVWTLAVSTAAGQSADKVGCDSPRQDRSTTTAEIRLYQLQLANWSRVRLCREPSRPIWCPGPRLVTCICFLPVACLREAGHPLAAVAAISSSCQVGHHDEEAGS